MMPIVYECQGCKYRWRGSIKTLQEMPVVVVPPQATRCCGSVNEDTEKASADSSRCRGENIE